MVNRIKFKKMKIGFIGVGKLGQYAAEVMAEKLQYG